jgi:hypothetical protein
MLTKIRRKLVHVEHFLKNRRRVAFCPMVRPKNNLSCFGLMIFEKQATLRAFSPEENFCAAQK